MKDMREGRLKVIVDEIKKETGAEDIVLISVAGKIDLHCYG